MQTKKRQDKKRQDNVRGAFGLLMMVLSIPALLSLGPAAQARVEQELYPTRQAAALAARKMGGPTVIVYDKLIGKYAVTLLERPPASRAGSGETSLNINEIYTPKPGSAERRAILDALRPSVEKDIGMPVRFVIRHPELFLRVKQGWAFVGADFQHPDGSPMGPSYYARFHDDSDTVLALLRRLHGRWQVVYHDTGAVDVEWPEWSQKYHAPASLFPKVP